MIDEMAREIVGAIRIAQESERLEPVPGGRAAPRCSLFVSLIGRELDRGIGDSGRRQFAHRQVSVACGLSSPLQEDLAEFGGMCRTLLDSHGEDPLDHQLQLESVESSDAILSLEGPLPYQRDQAIDPLFVTDQIAMRVVDLDDTSLAEMLRVNRDARLLEVEISDSERVNGVELLRDAGDLMRRDRNRLIDIGFDAIGRVFAICRSEDLGYR